MQLRSGFVVAGALSAPVQSPTSGQPGTSSSGVPDGHQRESAFREGVRLCLLQWTALQLAVENQWGGRNSAKKAQELGEIIVAWFAARAHKRGEDGTPRFYADELEDILDEAVLQDFNMELDDGSLQEVSEKLVEVHEQCWVGNFATVLQLQQEEREKQSRGGRTAAASSRRQTNNADDDSEDEDMDAEEEDSRIGDGQSMAVDSQQTQIQGRSANAQASSNASVRWRSQIAVSQLSQQEVDDGWQQVPVTRSRR